MIYRFVSGLIFLLMFPGTVNTADPSKPHDMSKIWQKFLSSEQFFATAIFDEQGALWLTRVEDGHVLVSHSSDQGKSFSKPVKVNQQAGAIVASGETRPKILWAKNGNIYIAYTQSLEISFAGNIRFSCSVDGGKGFTSQLR